MRILLTLLLVFLGRCMTAQVSCPSPPGQAGASACAVCDFTAFLASTAGQLPSNPGADWCGGAISNDQYFGFVAGGMDTLEFEVTVTDCEDGSGIQLAIYDADGVVVGTCIPDPLRPGQTTSLFARGLTVGQYYFLGIDGYAGSFCNFTVTPIRGLINSIPFEVGPIYGPTTACWNSTTQLSIDSIPSATGYFWEVTPGAFTAGILATPAAAFDPKTGSKDPFLMLDLPEAPLSMPMNTCDTIQFRVSPLNTCHPPDTNLSAEFKLTVCRNEIDTIRTNVCLGDSLEYPAGSANFFGPAEYFQPTPVSISPSPATGCNTSVVLVVEPISFSDTLTTIIDTAFCSLSTAIGFNEPALTSGIYYIGLSGVSGCGLQQPYNVIDVGAIFQQFPDTFCAQGALDSIYDRLPQGLEGILMFPGGTVVDTSTFSSIGLTGGFYDFEITGPGCARIAQFQVLEPITLEIDTSEGVFTGNIDGSAMNIRWTVDGIAASSTRNFSVNAAPGDTLIVNAQAWNTCDSISTSTIVVGPRSSSLQEAALVSELRVWPNPTHGQLTWAGRFEAGATPLSLSVYDDAGRLLKTRFLSPLQNQQESLSLLGHPSGSYRLVWTTTAGTVIRNMQKY